MDADDEGGAGSPGRAPRTPGAPPRAITTSRVGALLRLLSQFTSEAPWHENLPFWKGLSLTTHVLLGRTATERRSITKSCVDSGCGLPCGHNIFHQPVKPRPASMANDDQVRAEPSSVGVQRHSTPS